MTTFYEMNEDFLAHYGVLGMKWGRRKAKKSSGEIKSHIRESAHRYKQRSIKRNEKKIAKLQDRNKEIQKTKRTMIKNSDLETKYRKQTSTGKKIVQTLLFGTTGAETYRLARAKGKGRVKAAVTRTPWNK